jgi:hypothetical protein
MNLGIIAGCISIAAFIPYLISILMGKTKPNRVTWWIWSGLGILLFFSYKESGATDTLWVAETYVVTPFLVALLSIEYGEGTWSRLDVLCAIGAIIGTVLWHISGSPQVALSLYIGIDLLGLLPTVKKTYLHPEQEDKLAWFLMVIANCFNLLTALKASFFVMLYPLYMILSGSLILALSMRRISAKR